MKLVFLILLIFSIGIGCLYIRKQQRMQVIREFNTIQPLDFTVTYCTSCHTCRIQEQLDAIEFENCLQEDLDKLDAHEKESACQL